MNNSRFTNYARNLTRLKLSGKILLEKKQFLQECYKFHNLYKNLQNFARSDFPVIHTRDKYLQVLEQTCQRVLDKKWRGT